MKNNFSSLLAVVLLFATVGISMLSGITFYNWMNPESTGEAILFAGTWGMISYMTYRVLNGLISLVHKEN